MPAAPAAGAAEATGSAGADGRPRVLLLIKGLGLGGAERLLVDVMATRDRERFDYEVAYVLSSEAALVPAMKATGVPVHCLGGSASADLRWTRALRRLLARGHYDVLHAHLPYTAALGRLVALTLPGRHRPVLVYTEHSLWNKAAVVTKALNRATVGIDQALIVVSTAARDALPLALRTRARVVVHGVDRARFAELLEERQALRGAVRHELAVPDDELIALTVANLRSEKGYDVLLAAARLVVADGAPVRFVSVGRGPLEGELTAAADAAGLAGHLLFLGTRTDTARLMAGADIFVLPSHQEGLPVALMEAMSAGLPVVATVVGGVPDVVTDGVEGLLVPPGRADRLAEAVSQVARDPALRARLAEASLARSEVFDVRRAARVIESVYTELLDARRPR
jgi:glycosyltransferase involved in cell wall biosynthesis